MTRYASRGPLRGPMIPAPAKAGDRPMFMGPGSPPAFAGVGRDDGRLGLA
jgi:hypothetical protein